MNKSKKVLDHQKFLERMGVSKKQLKSRKKIKTDSYFISGYADRYYEDKLNGGIEYTPKSPHIDVHNETPETRKEIHRKQTIGLAMIDAGTGPRDLDYPVKILPEQLKL